MASKMAVDLLGERLRFMEGGVGAATELEALEEALMEVSQAIRAEGRSRLELLGMGTTVVAAWMRGGVAHVAHLGDSRAYLARGRKLERLTRDHSVVELLLRHGEITKAEAANHPARGRLSRFAGMEPLAHPDGVTVAVREGDRILLCTDGLWGMLADAKLRRIMLAGEDCATTCRALIEAGQEAGGADNLTAVVVEISGG